LKFKADQFIYDECRVFCIYFTLFLLRTWLKYSQLYFSLVAQPPLFQDTSTVPCGFLLFQEKITALSFFFTQGQFSGGALMPYPLRHYPIGQHMVLKQNLCWTGTNIPCWLVEGEKYEGRKL
jgi:hypothetical protein